MPKDERTPEQIAREDAQAFADAPLEIFNQVISKASADEGFKRALLAEPALAAA